MILICSIEYNFIGDKSLRIIQQDGFEREIGRSETAVDLPIKYLIIRQVRQL